MSLLYLVLTDSGNRQTRQWEQPPLVGWRHSSTGTGRIRQVETVTEREFSHLAEWMYSRFIWSVQISKGCSAPSRLNI